MAAAKTPPKTDKLRSYTRMQIARNSESSLSTDGSAFKAHFGTTEDEVNNNAEIDIALTQSDSYWLRP